MALDGYVKVIKSKQITNHSATSSATKITAFKIGTTSCNLERISYMKSNTPVPGMFLFLSQFISHDIMFFS